MKLPKLQSTHVLPVILVLFALSALFGWLSQFLTDWMWFASEGYVGVLLKGLSLRIATGLFFAVAVFAMIAGNALWAVARTREGAVRMHPMLAQTPLARLPERGVITRLILGLCSGIAILFGIGTSAWWSDAMLYLNSSPFGYVEPILKREAAFYVFNLPMLIHMRNLLIGVTILSALLCTGVYFVRGALGVTIIIRDNRVVARKPRVSPEARRHLAAHLCSLLFLAGFALYVRRFEKLYEQGTLLSGPGYKDAFGTLPLLFGLAVIFFVGALVVYHAILRQNMRQFTAAISVIVVGALIASVYPGMLQKFSVLANEFNRERVFIEHHIQATRIAFGLDHVEERFLSGQAQLTRAEIESNRDTIQNIRLWDHEPLLETFGQVQEIRTYYKFNSVDNDRYTINGELRQTMLSPRELSITDLPNRTWVNERLTYTHGHGVAMGPVNQVDPEGLPELFIKDLPASVKHQELAITRPEIYFGEEAHEPVFVRTRSKEFDYPAGDQNVFSEYQEEGGVRIGSLWRRLLFAIRYGDFKILLTSDFTEDSRILLRRNIVNRVETIAPFFSYDRDPYMVIDEGRLIWIIDGYTGTSRFPYSPRISTIGNYQCNAVKVTVDAYTGRMAFYLADPTDPIASAWGAIFPSLLRSLDDLPPGLRSHLRHPEDLFEIQAHLFGTYHMDDPQMFYNREDEWQIPQMPITGADPALGERSMRPYYTVMKLPGENSAEFIQMIPFTPHGKDNLAAWMVARSDPEHYGELVVYRFPKERLVFGPRQIISRINQDDTIAPQLTLWNQQGSNVVLGTLLVIPVQESLIYVQPLYLRADKGKIPELKRVILGYESQIVMGANLEEALDKIFPPAGVPPSPVPPAATPTPSPNVTPGSESPQPSETAPTDQTDLSLARQAREAYDAARSAAQQGDWTRYGQELERLGTLLNQLEQSSN